MTELKPCPFCGSDAEVLKRKDGELYIECTECYCSVGATDWLGSSLEDLIKAWNTRVKEEINNE